jgi:hypothetical protein
MPSKIKRFKMKKFGLYISAGMLLLSACKKNTFGTTKQESTENKALVKLALFNAPTVAPTLLVYNNGERISGALPLTPNGYPFPGGGFNTAGSSNGDYLALNPGSNKFEFYTTNPGTANIITKFFETTQTFDANKKYTVYTTDTAANAVAITAPDDAAAPDSGFSRIRFVNLIPNTAAVDFYKGNTLLKSNVKYKEFTDFFDVQYGSDSFSVRIAGSPAGSALSSLAYRVIVPTNKRIYSFLSRGYVGATGNRAPAVAGIVNQ